MALSPTALDRHGRPLRGAADPLYYQRERERARQGGRELRLLDEAEHATAVAQPIPEPAPKPDLPPLKPGKITLRQRALNLIKYKPRTAAEIALKLYGERGSYHNQKVYGVLKRLRAEGLIISANRQWHLVSQDNHGWPVCPHCGQKVKGLR